MQIGGYQLPPGSYRDKIETIEDESHSFTGRPKGINNGEGKRTENLNIRVTKDEIESFRARAKSKGMSLTRWVLKHLGAP